MDHFRNGGGRPVTLSETGNLAGLIFQYFYPALVIDRINAQIIDAARRVKSSVRSPTISTDRINLSTMLLRSGAVSSAGNLQDRSKPKTA